MMDDHFKSMILALEQNGLSRAEIAQQCRISTVTVWRLAAGIITAPTLKTARRVEEFHRSISPVKQKVV